MACSKTSIQHFNAFAEFTDEDVHIWYQRYFPKGYERLLHLFATTAITPSAMKRVPTWSPSPTTAIASNVSSGSIDSSSSSPSRTDHPHPRKKNARATASSKSKATYCTFCFNNDELPVVYNSHYLRDRIGSILCPILREKECDYCGATGDNAHTPKYCPKKPVRKVW